MHLIQKNYFYQSTCTRQWRNIEWHEGFKFFRSAMGKNVQNIQWMATNLFSTMYQTWHSSYIQSVLTRMNSLNMLKVLALKMLIHSYFSMANYEISYLLSPSGVIQIYSQSLTCSATRGELEFSQNDSHMWTSSVFRAWISPIISSLFM